MTLYLLHNMIHCVNIKQNIDPFVIILTADGVFMCMVCKWKKYNDMNLFLTYFEGIFGWSVCKTLHPYIE